MQLHGLFGKKVCVAVSGGVDSTALLHYLKNREKECGYLLSAVHCEHGIRGEESLRDLRFVQSFCERLGVPLLVFACDCPKKAETEKVSLETAARNFRKEVFSGLVQGGKADYIATAHHALDEAETVLFRLARGTALSGVVGMRERDGYILRPFLRWTKEQVLAYAKENGLEYCVDSTNLQTDATRNKLRLQVLPALSEAVDGAVENLASFAEKAAADDELLYELSAELLSKDNGEYLVKFCDKLPLFYRACLTACKGLGLKKDYTFAHLQAAAELQKSERGASVCLPCGIIAEKRLDGIAFYTAKEEAFETKSEPCLFTEKGFDGGRYEIIVSTTAPTGEENEWKTLRVDGDKIPKTAQFRFRRDGDKLLSFGGGKTLKKFFNEKKIPPKERAYLPLIAEETGEVHAICGVEISQKIKVDESTRRVLYIAIRKKGEQE